MNDTVAKKIKSKIMPRSFLEQKFLRRWFIFSQFLTIPSNFIITKLLRLKVVRPANFTLESGTLIIANHQSKIDPFLVSQHIGIKNLPAIVPIRYPVIPEYMNKIPLGFFIRLLGGYSIGETVLERAHKLIFTRRLLDFGYSVVIFPEGKIVRGKDMIEEFRKGAQVLFTENYPVVFVRLIGLNSAKLGRFWENKNVILQYGEPLGKEVSAEEKTEKMIEFFSS